MGKMEREFHVVFLVAALTFEARKYAIKRRVAG
jgi:hypothetical protein